MNTESGLAGTLAVSLQLPLVWRTTAPSNLLEASQAAMRALATAGSLGERPPLINEEALGLELEVARLHQKTQLLIELLAVALGRDTTRPAPVPLQFSSSLCSWHSHSAPDSGSLGAVALWLHAAAPEPLVWPAQVEALVEHEGDAALVQARLLPLGEVAQAALDRYIFQLHRRAIAEARLNRS